MKLGKDSKTNRGFQLVEFTDYYGIQCSLQQSSAIAMDENDLMRNPGSSFLWLGVDDPKPQIMRSKAEEHGIQLPPDEEVSGWMPYPIHQDVLLTTRMHLNREQVKGLIERMQAWLETGEL